MKQFLSAALLLFTIVTLPFSANAAQPRIIDEADLLSIEEEAFLEAKAARLAESYDMDVAIVTTNSLGGKSSEAYADDYYDDNGYGIGSDYSGTLLLLSMEYRDWAVSTCGEAIYALTDYGIQRVFSSISTDLSYGVYYEAFDHYLDALENYYSAYRSGITIEDFEYDYSGPGTFIPGTQEDIYYYDNVPVKAFNWYLRRFLISLAIGAAVAGIVLLIMRSKMNTAKFQRDASNYLKNGNAQITLYRDLFLYSRVSKTRKQEQDTGGGSSVHCSSSGRSHGGGHGKF